MASKLVQQLKRRAARLSRVIALEAKSHNEIADEVRTTSGAFIASPEWRAVRAEAVKRYGVTCCKCGRPQTRTRRVNFDHIKPRKFYPELALDINNLQPLCGPCNKAKGNGPAVDYRTPAAPEQAETPQGA